MFTTKLTRTLLLATVVGLFGARALAQCGNEFASCCEDNSEFCSQVGGGCYNSAGCCDAVIACDSFCGSTCWDEICAWEMAQLCLPGTLGACTGGPANVCHNTSCAGDCFAAHNSRGCKLSGCCQAVCAQDSFCCNTSWDSTCAGEANALCCEVAADCNDGNPCTNDSCVSNVCQHTNKPNGSACDDGVYCNGADTCSGGNCSNHAGDPCPGPDGDADCSERCNESTDSCTANDPNGSACNDGQFCNGTDTCSGGNCSSHAGDPCQGPDGDSNCHESCNEASNNCTANDPNGSACNDGLFCNGSDTCSAGSCSGHAGDPCQGPDGDADCSESCNENGDNCNDNDLPGSACNDGDACTENDVCSGGQCFGEYLDCDDGDPCTVDTCDNGNCVFAPSNNDCFDSNGTPSCSDPACCADVCDVDPFCCEVKWNQTCADEAEIICHGQFNACPSAGDCFNSNGGGIVGCFDQACCEEICSIDPYCCTVEWNEYCALKANVRCEGGQPPCPGEGSCFDSNGTIGCSEPACCAAVCAQNPYCCEVEWNDNCAALASVTCTGQTGCPGTGDCFSANGTPGCSDSACCEDICARDPFCCSNVWNDRCACEANVHCDGGGGVCPGTGDCFSPNGTPGCSDESCCSAVCAVNDYCCCQEWNQGCADLAGTLCGQQPACGPGRGDCFVSNGTLGCDDVTCCEEVCAIDPFCCTAVWNQQCVDEAAALCLPTPGDCNYDDSVNAFDTLPFILCAAGPDVFIAPACACADLDVDGDVDLFDEALYQHFFFPEPIGACCRPDTTCVEDVTPSTCVTVHGGSFQGSGSTCPLADCGAPGDAVVINELLGSTTSDDDEFIELYNASPAPVNIGGWFVELWDSDSGGGYGTPDGGSPYVIPGAPILPPGGFYLLANTQFSSSFPAVTPDLVFPNNGIENSSYTVILKNASGQKINTIFVTDGGTGDSANEAGNPLTPDLTVGPDGSFLPAGFYRTTDGGPVIAFLEFSPKPAASATPGASNGP